ncbi:MAG: Jag N-terminal domain-containing protein [Endomicrobium sp.]|jgi:spoIIIJ-associated protein|uniref:Jag N-terminal domain-containing protein n=1 Tax=Candidatus Endomicrobiellum cubanum TaxID=3242325 RepID=UPI002819EF2C|nr:Jag N-terminal domain-containing protein [Endomicrobium sp.]MDR2395355.1 Jag N-terminal domain-containing protein [Endomicrobium sp.]
MIELEFKGKTVEEAISKGLKQLGCKKEDVTVKVVTEGSSGLFGQVGTKPAVVLMFVEDSKCVSKV